MLLNRRKLNTHKLNTDVFVGYSSSFPGGVVVSFAQSVATSFSGNVMTFKQDVRLRSTYSGSAAIIFAQNVVHTNTPSDIIIITQIVE